jgi:hypothetical protein
MIPLVAVTATRSSANPWLASVYAGVISAVLAVITTFLFPNIPVGYIIFFLLIGVGPVIGYQLATGQGMNWGSLVGAFIGSIPLIILWPILVGALTKGQSIGKLLLAQLIAIVLGLVVFLIIATVMGQDPAFFPFAFTMYSAVWAGAMGAMMTAWQELS